MQLQINLGVVFVCAAYLAVKIIEVVLHVANPIREQKLIRTLYGIERWQLREVF